MQITLSGHHIDLTDALRNYVNGKLERIARHCENASSAHVILSVEKLRHKAEATIHVSGNDIFADSVQDDMYAAIDTLVDKIDRQVKKHKEKLIAQHRSHEKPARINNG